MRTQTLEAASIGLVSK